MSIKATSGPFEGTAESLREYRTPEWFRDAKLGIFIHWGIYSVPARVNEWYPKEMYGRFRDLFRKFPPDPRVWWHHRLRFGGRKKKGYKDFISDFDGAKWDPAAWAEKFQRWGARYIVPVGEHHDGFPMYNTPHTGWNAAKMGPTRDVIRELKKEVTDRDMHFGISTHRAFNWSYYRFYKGDDTLDPANRGLYGEPHAWNEPESDAFLADWEARVKEMVTEFRPEVIYFDFGWHRPRFDDRRKPMAAWIYNHGLENGYEPVINYKHQQDQWYENKPQGGGTAGFEEGSAVLDIERGGSADVREHPWQTCTSISYRSWGYIDGDRFRKAGDLIRELIDIVAKNGNLLINIGPRPDGTIPGEAAAPLEELGNWLETNGEAIYGTRPWKTVQEGPTRRKEKMMGFDERPSRYRSEDYRFTASKDGRFVYVFAMGQDQHRKGVPLPPVRALSGTTPKSVELLGGGPIDWTAGTDGLEIRVRTGPAGDHPAVYRVEL